ncbi:major facilitator transporter [Tepidicaulis marinus]|uniref:Major facilitator transporter n=1 Tax=Tepidicaulis marinus TaxID=1333998 RepID=A0A081BFB1_9HYPH|nr:MFS transporter [Tepidicaulis marinus]GAK46729.1 major facilitator transporter [Tepidicaulis marinus]
MSADRLPRWRVAMFSLPAIPIAAMGLPLTVYLPPFYGEADMGLSLATVGWIFMLARFWDVFTDPVLGAVSDEVSSRWGRRRHWIVLSAPILMLSAWMLFMPSAPVTAGYVLFWLFFLYVGWTLITICHMSWGAELSLDYDERSAIQGSREAALIFGMLTVLALPALIEMLGEDVGSALKVESMGWFIIVMLPLTIWAACYFVGEPHYTDKPQTQNISLRQLARKIGATFREIWVTIYKNRLIRHLLIADILASGAPAITGALYIYFAVYVMELPMAASLLLLVYFVTGFLGVPFWIKISHWSGKHRALAYASIYGAISLPLVIFFPRGEFWWLFVGNSLYGIAYGASSFLLRSMMADVTDHDYLETGERRTGLYYSLLTMTQKVAAALAVGITYPLLDVIGFTPKAGANSPETLNQLLYIYVGFPAVFMLLAAYVIWRFPLGRAAQAELRRRIEAKEAGHSEHYVSDAEAAIVQYGSSGGIADRPAD